MAEPRKLNVFEASVEWDASDPDGFRAGMNRFGPALGASQMGGSVYDLPPGQAICPYHYELAEEEWLIVLAGRPTLRTPEGESELHPGDVVVFPRGPEGAHGVANRGTDPVRVLMVSTMTWPAATVYPDSDKIGVFAKDVRLLFRRDSAVDYFDGELGEKA